MYRSYNHHYFINFNGKHTKTVLHKMSDKDPKNPNPMSGMSHGGKTYMSMEFD